MTKEKETLRLFLNRDDFNTSELQDIMINEEYFNKEKESLL